MKPLLSPKAALAVAILASTPAVALPPQVFVSSKGADAAGCGSPSAPCRTLQYAHDNAAAAGGVIAIADSGEFGPIKVTKSVSILNNGAGAALVSGSTGATSAALYVDIPAGKVVLSGLTVDGANSQDTGLYVANAKALDVSRCRFRRFRSAGISISGNVAYSIADTESSDNGSYGAVVIGDAGVDGVVKNSRFNRNPIGFQMTFSNLYVSPTARVDVKNVEINGSATGFDIAGPGYRATLTAVSVTNATSAFETRSPVADTRITRSSVINTGKITSLEGAWFTSSGDNQATSVGKTAAFAVVPLK